MDFYSLALIQGLGYASMGLGIYISLRIFNIPDITTDGSYTLGGVITAVLLTAGMHPFLVVIAALAGGGIAGITTGLIHTRMRVNPLLSGILVMTALYSVNLVIMGRSNLPLDPGISIQDKFGFTENTAAVQWILYSCITILVAAFLVWLLKTDFGIAMRATGNNEPMVRAMGINTLNMKVFGLALSNMLTALSGYLLVQYQGFADINMGIGIVISGLAAVMTGEALARIIAPGKLVIQVLMVIAGSLLFRSTLAFALTLGLHPDYLKLVTAMIVLLVLGITRGAGLRGSVNPRMD
jgi:putative ABC transport system permease protein